MAKNKIYIPTFISSVNYAPARVLPHIYFYNGTKQTDDYYVQGYVNNNTGILFNDNKLDIIINSSGVGSCLIPT